MFRDALLELKAGIRERVFLIVRGVEECALTWVGRGWWSAKREGFG
jgi:hypothetical protein